jgi:hypothetical protein
LQAAARAHGSTWVPRAAHVQQLLLNEGARAVPVFEAVCVAELVQRQTATLADAAASAVVAAAADGAVELEPFWPLVQRHFSAASGAAAAAAVRSLVLGGEASSQLAPDGVPQACPCPFTAGRCRQAMARHPGSV